MDNFIEPILKCFGVGFFMANCLCVPARGNDSVSEIPVTERVSGTGYGDYQLSRFNPKTDALFSADSLLRGRAQFWFNIYTSIGEAEGLLHDADHMDIVYARLSAPGAYTRSGRIGVNAAMAAVQMDLKTLAGLHEAPTDPTLKALKSLVPANWDSVALVAASERLRFQRGLRERFTRGLASSYRWLPTIESTLVARGLPPRLQYLPHVESSFMPSAYSKVGAAGMWQFMKATGKRYGMKTNYLIDERRDPVRSTEGAARLLSDSYRIVGTWPLALTGYNHGPSGVARAVKSVGSQDLSTIIRQYDGGRFGFASGNFYAEFLAASSIAISADSLFPTLAKEEPVRLMSLGLSRATGIRHILQATGLSPLDFEAANLSLRPTVFGGNGSLPKGWIIRLPTSVDTARVMAALRLSPATETATLEVAKSATQVKPLVIDKVEAPMRVQPQVQPKVVVTATISAVKDIPVTQSLAPELPPGMGTVSEAVKTAIATSIGIVREGEKSQVEKAAEAANSLLYLRTGHEVAWVHPYDRFDPNLYNLAFTYSHGRLNFQSGSEETLSHYAEWSGLSMTAIRSALKVRGKQALAMNRSVHLNLTSAQVDAFVRSREENYRAVEEDFYGSYYVQSLEPLAITPGMSVWSLAQDRELPYWLLQKHNQGRNLAQLKLGDTLQIPVVVAGIRP
jgi:membrane-bound lytic murein transglycosylase D